MGVVTDYLKDIKFQNIIDLFLETKMYDYLFPFLLFYAILYTVLQKVKIFQKDGAPMKSVIVIISFIISLIGVIFPINDKDQTVSDFLMVFFPHISTITILMLSLFLIATLMNKNFLDFFSEHRTNSYSHMALLIIAFGTMLFYMGIFVGFWDYDIMDVNSQWSFILAVASLIISIVLIAVESYVFGFILLISLFSFIYQGGDGNFLKHLFDPVILICAIFLGLFSWLNKNDEDEIKRLEREIAKSEKTLKEDFKKQFELDDYYDYNDSRIYPISKKSLDSKKERLEELKKKLEKSKKKQKG